MQENGQVATEEAPVLTDAEKLNHIYEVACELERVVEAMMQNPMLRKAFGG